MGGLGRDWLECVEQVSSKEEVELPMEHMSPRCTVNAHDWPGAPSGAFTLEQAGEAV